MTRTLAFACCTHCGCPADWRDGHTDPCDLGCGAVTVVNDGGVTAAQIDAYTDAVADRDRARGVATQLEGQLAEVLRLIGERFGNHSPHRPGVDATVWERQNAGRCMRCADMWPCSSSLFLKQINAVTQVTGWLEQRAQVALFAEGAS